MDEVHLESPARVLHIFPNNDEYNGARRETYLLDNLEFSRKRRFRFKCKLKRILKKRYFRRKFPHSTREHTEFDKHPYETTCPNCLCYVRTKIYHYSTGVTHAFAATLFPICMCMVPYFTDKYKNTAHYCPICKIYLGTKFGSGRNVFYYCITVKKCE